MRDGLFACSPESPLWQLICFNEICLVIKKKKKKSFHSYYNDKHTLYLIILNYPKKTTQILSL